MIKDLVTVVLPVYNVEKYLDRAMESVVGQTYEKLEIILVDDGSTDSSSQMCDKWAERDERVKVIHKSNEGLGMARNTGMENAAGEYICFFDSDDYIAEDTIEKAMSAARDCNADVVVFGFFSVNGQGDIVKTTAPDSSKKVYSGEEIQNVFLPDLIAQGEHGRVIRNLWMSAWSGMYSSQLIKSADWEFVSEREIISEDVFSLLELYSKVSRAAVLNEALYYYCENTGSLTHKFRRDRLEKIDLFYGKCLDLCASLDYPEKIRKMLVYPYLANVIAAFKMIVKSDSGFSEKHKAIKRELKSSLFCAAINDVDFKYENRMRGILLNSMRYKMALLVYLLIWLKG